MKNILIGLMILVSTMCSAQINSNKTTPINKIDTTKLCFPAEVGKQILIDLNECDKNKELLKLTEKEVDELNNKITQKDNIINSLNQKDSLSSVIITKTEEKFKIVYDENENLRKDMKKMRTKHIVVQSITGFISATLIYIIAFK
jgi:hypothetical protein